jgi:hypothetical protein
MEFKGKEKEKKITISITVKSEHLEYLDENANDLGMSRSSYISMLISNAMKSKSIMEMMPEFIDSIKSLDEKVGELEKNKNDEEV